MTNPVEQVAAFALLALIGILVFAPAKAPPDERTLAAELPTGDYRDAVIDALHAEILSLERKLTEWEEHHEAVHRGECVPRPGW